MRWPWSKRPERREAAGGYTEIIGRLIEAQAAGSTQQASATAATEAAAGLLSRSFAAATVEGPPDIAEAVSPSTMAQIGRDLVRVGESLHVIRLTDRGVRLIPASTWYWEGNADPADWLCTATAYGPSGSSTWRVPWSSVIFIAWGAPTARPYHGLSPSVWAADTSRLHANAERGLANEAGGPTALLLPIPEGHDAGSDDDDDPLASLRADIAAAKGRALLLETTSSGFGEGKANAPARDWQQSRLGPSPTEHMVSLADAAFQRMLAAAGVPPSLFLDSDGTSQREAVRRYHMNVVMPLARILETELRAKLDAAVRLRFDGYAMDLVSRAQVVAKLTAAGVELPAALQAVGLAED